jgi:hypothetical protein
MEKKIPWPESASELYRPNDRRLSAKLVSTFADRGCHVVSVTDPYGRILGFLDRSRNFFFITANIRMSVSQCYRCFKGIDCHVGRFLTKIL